MLYTSFKREGDHRLGFQRRMKKHAGTKCLYMDIFSRCTEYDAFTEKQTYIKIF